MAGRLKHVACHGRCASDAGALLDQHPLNLCNLSEHGQHYAVGSPEEVAFRMGWIDAAQLQAMARSLGKTELGRVLSLLAAGQHG